MGFRLRKSINLGGGARMTFSKSGISTSVGGKGFRVTAGPRGTFVTVGAKGIHYRQRIGGYVGGAPPARVPTSQPTPQPVSQPTPQPVPQAPPVYQTGTPIVTADASQLIELSSAATLEQLNTVSRQPAYAWLFLVGGGIVGLLLAQVHIILLVLVLGLSGYVASIANKLDKERRTFHLQYEMDAQAQQKWGLLNQCVSSLGRSLRLWRITTHDPTYDWKRNAGASSLLTRNPSSVQQRTSRTIASNVNPYVLDIGTQQFYFFPDRVYVLENGTYGAVEYASLMLGVGQTRFIEEQGVPSDAQTVGQTWRFVNKSGGPDRRFNNNYQIPIAQYGVVELKSSTGLNLLLHVSSVAVAEQFTSLFQSFQGHRAQEAPASRFQQPANPRPAPPPPPSDAPPRTSQRRRTTPPKPSPSKPADCYAVLGLTSACTKEEAAAKYRQLAMAYHPDRVSHMAVEFQTLATQKVQEINLAYAEIKRLRGW